MRALPLIALLFAFFFCDTCKGQTQFFTIPAAQIGELNLTGTLWTPNAVLSSVWTPGYNGSAGFDQYQRAMWFINGSSSAPSTASSVSFTLGSTSVVGTGATASCATNYQCNSVSGVVTVTTGTGVLLVSGTVLTVNFLTARSFIPNCSATLIGASLISILYPVTESTTSLQMSYTGILTPGGTVYKVKYTCLNGM